MDVEAQQRLSRVDVAVIGGGIVGLASARAILAREPQVRLCVLEKEHALAAHQSGRNSGVVHAGVYYTPGSIKARLCVAGRVALKEFTARRDIAYQECGKLIVAVDDAQVPALEDLFRRASSNGVPEIRMLDDVGLRQVEPAARGVAALHSPATAITDYPAICRAFVADIQSRGGSVVTGFEVVGVTQDADRVDLAARDGRSLRAGRVLVCAGLYGDRLAALAGDTENPRIVPFRGDYYRIDPSKASLVRGLVYPVPDPALPFLGVHLTRTVRGDVLVGPNALLATAREGYRLTTFRPRDFAATLTWPGSWHFARRYWRVGFAEMRRSASKKLFTAEASALVPAISPSDLIRAPAGVRAQALDRDGTLVEDFAITRVGHVVNVRNAPSPAATSSIPIGEELATQLLGSRES